jgi:MarR family transcriptional regulator, organic hydroperoxide resistance regulator
MTTPLTVAGSPGPEPQAAQPRAADLDPLARVGRSFKAAMGAVRRLRGRDTHRPGQLSYAQYGLLFGLAESTGLSSRDLAIAADLSPATVTPMLDHLAEAGLVDRTRSESDKRVVIVSLTERGHALVRARHARLEPRWRAALLEFDDDELLSAARVLDRLTALFNEFDDDQPSEVA